MHLCKILASSLLTTSAIASVANSTIGVQGRRTRIICGGFFAKQCPHSYKCLDRKGDLCGHRFGWMDCWGTCEKKESTTKASPSPITSATSSCGALCVDYINSCGERYGGCYDTCQPSPTFTPPPCSSTLSPFLSKSSSPSPYPTTSPPALTSTATSSGLCYTQCEDYRNSCGVGYGGCYNVCSSKPSFTPPPCPSTTPSGYTSASSYSSGPAYTSSDTTLSTAIASSASPKATPHLWYCGGDAAVHCPAGNKCIDIPGDECRAIMGGRDCAGMCVRKPHAETCKDGERCTTDYICVQGRCALRG